MARYRKKPVVVEAFKYDPADKHPEWFDDAIAVKIDDRGLAHIYTLEGVMIANPGDYIIEGVKGELYPCKPDIFEETYEEVADA